MNASEFCRNLLLAIQSISREETRDPLIVIHSDSLGGDEDWRIVKSIECDGSNINIITEPPMYR